jgi:type I restriction enzyme S subunit
MNAEIKEHIEQLRRGKVPEGYKREVPYVVPADWLVCKMGSISNRVSKANKDKADLPAYSINNQIGFILQSEQFEAGSYSNLEKTTYKIVECGEFAYNPARINVGSIGRLKNIERVIISSLYVCFHLDDRRCDGTFFENWFNTLDFYKETVRNLEGSVREYLFYENFSNIRAPLPSITEQKKIAEILSHCDKVIDLKKQLIEEKRRRKKWLMQKLLNPDSGIRLPGFERSEWAHYTLGQLGEFSKGYGISNDNCLTGETPCIKYGDIYMSFGAWFDNPVSFTEAEIADNAPFVSQGTLLFTGSGEDRLEIGKCTAYMGTTPIAVGGDIIIMKPNINKVNPLLLAYIQHSEGLIRQKAELSQGYSVVHIYANDIKRLIVNIPSTLDEQGAIVNILLSTDRELDLLEQELIQWQLKKKSLMQLLLTGIVRV